MQAVIDYRNAFRDATDDLAKLRDTGGELTQGQIATWCGLSADMNAAAAEAAAAEPETSEDAAAKLELAADAIEQAAFEGDDPDILAAKARAIAADLAAGQDSPGIVARLRRLLASCEYANFAFWRIHGFSCPGHSIEHLRTTSDALTRLRLAA